MEAKATLRYIRISPRKVGILCDLIRGKSIAQANAILALTPKAAAEPLMKLVNSAAANAENNHMPRAQGRAYRINKRTSHVTVVVKER